MFGVWHLVLYKYVELPNLRVWYTITPNTHTYLVAVSAFMAGTYCMQRDRRPICDFHTISPGSKQRVKPVIGSKDGSSTKAFKSLLTNIDQFIAKGDEYLDRLGSTKRHFGRLLQTRSKRRYVKSCPRCFANASRLIY